MIIHLKKLLLVALFSSAILSSPSMASYVSDGSAGIFHPSSDTILDLSGPAGFPQFSNIYIDSGIRITVLTPVTGYGYLLSADGIYLNGILDAGTGAVSLNAFNSIAMGGGSQLIGWNLALSAKSMTLQGTIQLSSGGVISASPSDNLQLNPSVTINSGGDLIVSNGGDLSLSAPVPLPAASILLGSGFIGLLSLVAGRRRR